MLHPLLNKITYLERICTREGCVYLPLLNIYHQLATILNCHF